MNPPATPNDEGSRAQHWRQQVMGLSIKDLAELTGYSSTAIRCFEADENSAGELIGEAAWRRYRLCCAGTILVGKYGPFDWDMWMGVS